MTLSAALAVLAFAAPPAGAATLHIEELRLAAGTGPEAVTAVSLPPAPCVDGKFRKIGVTQSKGSYSWSFNSASTPKYLVKSAVRDTLVKSFSNITSAHNDCGMPDNVSATHTFLGSTTTTAKCNRRDFHNVIGFKKLEWGVLAVTCFWSRNGHMVEADIQINSRERWVLTLNGCDDEVMLEGTMTHEAGHVFGLDHVGEVRHGRLTMSPFLDGPCQNSEATLGKGDVHGLESMY